MMQKKCWQSLSSENIDEDDGDQEADGKISELEKLVNEDIASESNEVDDDFVFE